jgi:hypothetical protein
MVLNVHISERTKGHQTIRTCPATAIIIINTVRLLTAVVMKALL